MLASGACCSHLGAWGLASERRLLQPRLLPELDGWVLTPPGAVGVADIMGALWANAPPCGGKLQIPGDHTRRHRTLEARAVVVTEAQGAVMARV